MSEFIDPATQTPLFTAQYITCVYPISDTYASSPRYLFYALIIASFIVRGHAWLANVFLGAAATYAGTAAIESFILISHQPYIPPEQQVSIPYVSSTSVKGNSTLEALRNLVTDTDYLYVQPAVMQLDIDAILAICVTSYLTMLPMHCWSSVVRKYRAFHLLVGLWNIMMLAGSICSLILWPTLSQDYFPIQFRFCYPTLPDPTSITNDGWDSSLWHGSWNKTIWDTFQNSNVALNLSDDCFYPCFNTSQILRKATTITASLDTNRSPHTAALTGGHSARVDSLTTLMYIALAFSTAVALALLILIITPLNRFTRVPIHRPILLWSSRKELVSPLWSTTRSFFAHTGTFLTSPVRSWHTFQTQPNRHLRQFSRHLTHFVLDTVALLLLIATIIFIPVINILFIIWIEYYIHRDLVSSDAAYEVGQWSSSVSIGLILVSALVLQLRWPMATEEEYIDELERKEEQVQELKERLEKMRVRKAQDEQLGGRKVEVLGMRLRKWKLRPGSRDSEEDPEEESKEEG